MQGGGSNAKRRKCPTRRKCSFEEEVMICGGSSAMRRKRC